VSGRVPRRASRQLALQVLYAVDLAEAGDADEVFASVAQNFELPAGARAFARELVRGVIARRDALDELLARHSEHWRVSRMAAVDRNVLRIAVFELLETHTPTSVVIDQAIELARRFGDDPSPGFVNGVLDAVARAVERPVGRTAGSGLA